MEQETTTPGRGSPESAAWFRERLAELGIGQSELARLMVSNGDDRQFDTILRSLRRMASGDARVSGEMRAWLTLALHVRQGNLDRAALLEQQIGWMEAGGMHAGSNNKDTTDAVLAESRRQREELRKLPIPFAA